MLDDIAILLLSFLEDPTAEECEEIYGIIKNWIAEIDSNSESLRRIVMLILPNSQSLYQILTDSCEIAKLTPRKPLQRMLKQMGFRAPQNLSQ